MKNLIYYQAESDTLPEEIDTVSSPATVYIRKNVREEHREDIETGETRVVYVYDEAKVPKSEYNEYLSGKTQADIEYLYMMTEVDYE